MAKWYRRITANPDDYFTPLGEAIAYFSDEYDAAKLELIPRQGGLITELSSKLPGIVEHRYGQYMELEAILKFLNIQYDKKKGAAKRRFLENYNRQLSERLANEYADIEEDVVLIREFIQEVALVSNLFGGITKGFEYMHFQISNITRLKAAGVEDATF